jgi:hypothetical protein
MRKFCLLALLFVPVLSGFGTAITFPDLNIYTEISSNVTISSSYKVDMVLDTGVKYGVQIGLGLKNYNISSINSNLVEISAFKLTARPFDLFNFGYFIGKDITLGDTRIGYRGFQFHQKPNFEYIGYKDINGMGIDCSVDLFDNLFQPHVLVYQPDFTNTVYLDTVFYIKMENYIIEGYFGINNINIVDAAVSNTLSKHFGVFIKTIFGKIDLMLGLYSPDTLMTNVPTADDLYLNITEHINFAWFEQTMTLFTRPSSYNGHRESVTNDMDFYLAIGVKVDDLGFGVENTFLMAANYTMSDRVGAYFYLMMNNLQYKIGFFYNMMGTAFVSPLGGYISVTGSL